MVTSLEDLVKSNKELLKINQQLQQEIARYKIAEARLQEAKNAAERSNVAKSEFLANMSHEIRTPMNAIIGLTNLMLNFSLPEKIRDYLHKVERSSRSLLTIINDILDFSKIEAGKLQLAPVEFDIRTLLENLGDLLYKSANDKGNELNISVAPSVPYDLIGDDTRLEQLLINLIGNAIKFTKNGEVGIRVTAGEGNANHVPITFSVNDTGIGIKEDRMEDILARFSQADSTISRNYGGSGLGLSICKKLVDMMGGELKIESKFGQGSTFYFTINLAIPEHVANRPILPPEDFKKLNVLVVDDNQTARENLQEVMDGFKFKATTAASYQEAVEIIGDKAAKGAGFDLLFVDSRQPDMDSLVIIKRLLATLETTSPLKTPKIIMPIAVEDEWQKRKAGSIGVDMFLQKPLSCLKLHDAIMELFGREDAKLREQTAVAVVDAKVMEKIAGSIILVVDDNAINRDVAKAVLENVGVVVIEATNGKEALEIVWQTNFDAVLMDIQMPEMDGITATKRIREDRRRKNIPVIAMTANVNDGDNTEILAAGMVGRVDKPIDNEQLYSTLVKFIKPRHKKVEIDTIINKNAVLGQNSFPDDDFPDTDTITTLHRMGGDEKLYKNLMRSFARDYGEASETIQIALNNGETVIAGQYVHAIKGVAANLGADKLSFVANSLEQAIKKREQGAWPGLLADFSTALNRVLKSVATLESEEEQEQPENSEGKVLDLNEVNSMLTHLSKLLVNNDGESMHFLDALRPLFAGSKMQQQLTTVAEHLDKFDFESANSTLLFMREELMAEKDQAL
ncbi:MAG: response regulator [Magnetococcales bacterium]|nr:response regulator [Magnetococcales bacterium]